MRAFAGRRRVAHHADLLEEHEVPGAAQQIYCRLNDAQADERGSPAWVNGRCSGKTLKFTQDFT